VYQQRDSNRLIEEFMLLANMAVAHHIYTAFPKIALLRRHPKPDQRQIDELVKLCKSHGIQFNAQSSKTIHQSLARFPLGSAKREILVQYTMKPMKTARYFCSGSVDEDSFYHYALSVPFYTHFTSPIRRYADVIVHRLLVASLGLDVKVDEKKDDIDYIAKQCNDRKQAAKNAGELSNELFFAIFVRECGPLEDDGFVLAVMDQSVDVFVPALGVTKRVYCKLNPNIKRFEFLKNAERQPARLKLVWAAKKEDGKTPQDIEQTLSVFTKVRVILTTESLTEEKGEKNKHVKVFARLQPPSGAAGVGLKSASSPSQKKSDKTPIVQQIPGHSDVKKKLFPEGKDGGNTNDSSRSGIESDGVIVEEEVLEKDKKDDNSGSENDDVIVEEEEEEEVTDKL
jgi:DIS3-like exonuclease 2